MLIVEDPTVTVKCSKLHVRKPKDTKKRLNKDGM